MIVPVAVSSARTAFVGADSVRPNDSSGSGTSSSVSATETVPRVPPAGNVSVPCAGA